MKYLKFAMMVAIIVAVVSSCTNTTNNTEGTQIGTSSSAPRVEVVYFHGKQRCLTCRAIERFAKESVDSCFAGNDAVSFKVVDITTYDGEQIADEYEIVESALLIIKKADGKTSYEDMTTFAFQNARKNPCEFKSGIETKVKEYLN